MKLDAYIQTKAYSSDVHTVSFWGKASSADSYITVYGGTNSKDLVEIAKVEFYDTDSHTFDISADIPEGVKMIKLAVTAVGETGGTITLDDVTVVSGGTEVVTVPGYVQTSTGGATSITVDKLIDDCDQYSFMVQATNGTEKSGIAKIVKVEITEKSGVEDITVAPAEGNAPVIYYNLNGVQMNGDNLAPGLYIRRQGNDVSKVLVK
jgi:hypothetical protein